MYKYSIIVPHYDDRERLCRLISSIPIARGDIQLIIIDDCSLSSDQLTDLKSQYDDGILWLSTPINKGAGAARNIGLAHAVGTYVLFADSDDIFVEGAFNNIDDNIGGDTDLTYFLATAYNEIHGTFSTRADAMNSLVAQYIKSADEESLMNLKQGHVNPIAKVYKRSAIERLGYKFEEVMVSNDVAFNVLMALGCKTVKAVPEVIYSVTKREGSLTTKKNSRRFMTRVQVAASISDKITQLGFQSNKTGTGFLLESLKYGPVIAIRTFYIVNKSSLKIDFLRVFNLKRWFRFIQRQKSK